MARVCYGFTMHYIHEIDGWINWNIYKNSFHFIMPSTIWQVQNNYGKLIEWLNSMRNNLRQTRSNIEGWPISHNEFQCRNRSSGSVVMVKRLGIRTATRPNTTCTVFPFQLFNSIQFDFLIFLRGKWRVGSSSVLVLYYVNVTYIENEFELY